MRYANYRKALSVSQLEVLNQQIAQLINSVDGLAALEQQITHSVHKDSTYHEVLEILDRHRLRLSSALEAKKAIPDRRILK